MRKHQSGFTLIELVAVIVIIGVLAATAVPRFQSVTDDARLAVAQGVFGALLSSAVVQLAANNGSAADFATITSETDVESTDTVEVSLDGGTTWEAIGAVTEACAGAGGGDETLDVRVGGATGQTHSGTLPDALCDG